MPRPKPPTGGWEAENQRITFYCPADLAKAIHAAVRSDRSKTQVIVTALRAQLLDDAGNDDAKEAAR